MNVRGLLAFLHDVTVTAIAWCAAFWLCFNLDIPDEYQRAMLASKDAAREVLLEWAKIVFYLAGGRFSARTD